MPKIFPSRPYLDLLFQDAYVMAGRPLTPHKSVGYEKVNAELTNQITSIKTSRAKSDADKRLIERLYQIQLAEG